MKSRIPKLLLFSLLLIVLTSSESYAYVKYLTKNDKATVGRVGRYSLTYQLKTSAELYISVRELRRKKIKFILLQDGKTIYKSRVKSGLVRATVSVEKGTVSLVIINNNFLRKKKVKINVKAKFKTSFLSVLRRSKFSQVIDRNKRITLGPNKVYRMSYILSRPKRIYIKISEAFGKNIEFRVVQNGKTVYRTGVVKGGTKGIVKLKKGKFKILIKNGNWISSKTVDYFVAVLR